MEMVFFVLADQEVAWGGSSLLGGILEQAPLLSCCSSSFSSSSSSCSSSSRAALSWETSCHASSRAPSRLAYWTISWWEPGVLLAGTRREASVVTLSRDHDIWLLFTINTYLMPPFSPEPHLSLCVQDFGKSGLVSPDWFRPPAKCLYLMRVGNPDKCSIIRGNRKTRWISAEDLLCVNTKIYHPTKRGEFFCFPFHFETFS